MVPLLTLSSLSPPPLHLPLPCFPCPFHTIFGAGIERKFNDVKYGIVSLRNDEGTFLNFVFKKKNTHTHTHKRQEKV